VQISDIQLLQFDPATIPTPVDVERERSITTGLLDRFEKGENPREVVLATDGITEWVCWQLGLAAHLYFQDNRTKVAILTGTASVIAADRGEWTERMAANRITLAYILARSDMLDRAKEISEVALRLVEPNMYATYASCRSSLGIIALSQGAYLEAVHHFDSMLRVVRRHVTPTTLRALATTALQAYRQKEDLPGVLYCTTVLVDRATADRDWKKAVPQLAKGLNLESLMNVSSRLSAFGLDEYATQLRKAYEFSHP